MHHVRQALGDDRVSYLLGDVRDLDRLRLAFRGADTVIHAAALKHVPFGESNPLEFVATNIAGTANAIRAAIDCGVARFVLLATDKAQAPVNLYGATKLCAEKLTLQANTYTPTSTTFTVVRYGNVMGSRGSVLERWRQCCLLKTPLPVTDLAMTRFWMTLDEAVTLVERILGGLAARTTVVPNLPAFRLADLCRAVLKLPPDAPLVEGEHIYTLGLRPGEKIHETLSAPEDGHESLWRYHTAIRPYAFAMSPMVQTWSADTLPAPWEVLDAFSTPYRSDVWPWQLSVDDLTHRLEELSWP
jgi:UDP-N-acetylglucosamine 4,6-dehydratase